MRYYLSRLKEFLERSFDTWHVVVKEMLVRWHQNTNRRTLEIILCGGIIAAGMYLFVISPPGNFPVNTLVSVPEGSSLRSLSGNLRSEGVVRSAFVLRALVSVMGRERSVRAGDYLFKEPRNIFSVARALSIGQFGLEPLRVRIHEGAMVKEMALIFSRQLERINADRFLSKALPEEGYLFPDTYFFMPNATEDTIILAMRQNFDQHIEEIATQIASSTRTLAEIVTMASIVEREARDPDDRRMIAGVLWNRLERGMALQVDVTFLYTIGKGTFQLTTQDLMSDSPYNTYRYKGLPPSPIGSPSLDSLLAAAEPTKNDYLFYLADNSGVTYFSKTYSEHLRKKRLYLGT